MTTYKTISAVEPVDAVSSGSYGDNAVGTAYETVMRARLESGIYEDLTFAYFVEKCRTTNQPEVRDSHIVMERIETLHFTDPDDPGGSEVDCDYEYGEGSVFFYDDLADAEREARTQADWVRDYFEDMKGEMS